MALVLQSLCDFCTMGGLTGTRGAKENPVCVDQLLSVSDTGILRLTVHAIVNTAGHHKLHHIKRIKNRHTLGLHHPAGRKLPAPDGKCGIKGFPLLVVKVFHRHTAVSGVLHQDLDILPKFLLGIRDHKEYHIYPEEMLISVSHIIHQLLDLILLHLHTVGNLAEKILVLDALLVLPTDNLLDAHVEVLDLLFRILPCDGRNIHG